MKPRVDLPKLLRRLPLFFLIALVLAQLVPVSRENPPVTADLGAPPAVDEVLRRACYDCHSNETRWPWYARVAPLSWLIAHDVNEGREEINYSLCGELEGQHLDNLRQTSWQHVEAGGMPPLAYTLLHPEAKLSDADREILRRWAEDRAE